MNKKVTSDIPAPLDCLVIFLFYDLSRGMSMTTKAETIDQFLLMLRTRNANKISGDADLADLFGKEAPFAVVCNKCGSMDIDIFGEKGIDYGGWTGYQEGETVIKCNGCGAANNIWG